MAQHEIKAVLFDLGDTLLNFGRISTTRVFLQGARSSYRFLREHEQPVGPFAWYALRNLIRLRIRQLRSDLTGRDFDALTFLQDVGRRKGIQLSPKQWEQFAWSWYEPLSKLADVEWNVRETLAALKKLGLKLGIVSNTFVNRESLERHLSQRGLLEFFSVRLYSYEFAFRKPHLEIFRTAAQHIGEALENIVFVGDRIDKDIQPALRSGMMAVLKDAYTNVGKQTPAGAWKIRDLSELPGLIARANTTAMQPTRT